MKVLVTGATGFLGKYIINELENHNYKLIAFGRNIKVGKSLVSNNISFINGDFTDFNQINNALKNVNAVIHAGALSTIWGKWKDFYKANVLGTSNVIKACLNNNVKKLIYVSSPSIYTSQIDRFNIKEEDFDSSNDFNFYIKSKILAENLIKNVNKEMLYTNIIRPRGIIGIGDVSIIPRFINLNKKIGIPLVNNGNNIVDLTSAENVALALRLCLEHNDFNGHVYNITNGEPSCFKNLLDSAFKSLSIKPKYIKINYNHLNFFANCFENIFNLFKITKFEPPITRYTACLLSKSQTLCISRAKEELLYTPKITLKESFDIYAKQYR